MMSSAWFHVLFASGVLLSTVMDKGQGKVVTHNGPTSYAKMIDQGVAYILMILALAITYIIH